MMMHDDNVVDDVFVDDDYVFVDDDYVLVDDNDDKILVFLPLFS